MTGRVTGKVAIQALRDIVVHKIVDGATFMNGVPPRDHHHFQAEWDFWVRHGQDHPPGDWNVWMMLAGRGFGKTRSGAEWLRDLARWGGDRTRLALVGATAADARSVMVEGDSGILAASPDDDRPVWEPTRGRLVWPNGAQAYVYSAEAPERLRGPQFEGAWCDELAAWPDATARDTWNNLQFAMRIGTWPRVVATTTPRPTAFVRAILARPDTVVTGGATTENALLAASFVEAMTRTYGGTSLGRQELEGLLIDDRPGAMWTRAALDGCRVAAAPPLARVVVGVDPTASSTGDACGIVVAGTCRDGSAWVLEDATVAGMNPDGWASAVARAAARHRAECVVAEGNNGGAMVREVLKIADPTMGVRMVHASRGKAARAEPVSLLYARGLVHHVGTFPALEDELCGLMTNGYAGPGSPDRADALVWALTELMLGEPEAEPRVRVL